MKSLSTSTAKGAEEARQQLPAILAAAAAGVTTLITRHGREIAAVVPVAAIKTAAPASLFALAGSGRSLGVATARSPSIKCAHDEDG